MFPTFLCLNIETFSRKPLCPSWNLVDHLYADVGDALPWPYEGTGGCCLVHNVPGCLEHDGGEDCFGLGHEVLFFGQVAVRVTATAS